MLKVQKATNQQLIFSTAVGSGFVETVGAGYGINFMVTTPLFMEYIGWNRAFTAGLSIPVNIWGSSNTALASAIITDAAFPAKFNNKLYLFPGQEYRICAAVGVGVMRNLATVTTYPSYMNVLGANSSTLALATTKPSNTQQDLTTSNRSNFTFYFTDPAYEIRDVPPEPIIVSSAKQFLISLPEEWMPGDLKEWDLQYQKSTDNTDFGTWIDLATIPVQFLEDSPLDVDLDPEVVGVFTHTTAELTPPLPYYRYRYKLRSVLDQSDWSEPALAGQVKDLSAPISGGDILPGTIPGEAIDPNTDLGIPVSGSTLDGVTITHSTFATTNTNTGTITGGTMSPDTINATSGSINALTTNTITTTGLTSTGLVVLTDAVLNTLVANTSISSVLYTGQDIDVTGLINGNTLSAGVFNGVGISDGNIDGRFITAKTVTADKMVTGFLDANVSVASYIDASAIKGGQLTLGGKVTYQLFRVNDGTLVWPWFIQEMASSTNTLQYVQYPGGPTVAPANLDCTITLDDRIRVDFNSGASIPLGQGFRFLHSRANNSIRSMTFTVKGKLPTNMLLELVDTAGTARPLSSAAWTQAGTFTTGITTTPNVRADEFAGGLPSGLAIQVRATSAATVPDNTYYFEISSVQIEYEKGFGWLQVLDAQGRTRAEVTSEYIQFSKPTSTATQQIFRVDNNGVWVPSDGFTIGSTRINNLTYSQRDLSGSLCINPRFENLRAGNPNNILPSDWTYLGEDYVGDVNTKNWAPNAGFETNVSGSATGYAATVQSGGTLVNNLVSSTTWAKHGTRSVRLTTTNPDTTQRSTYMELATAYRIPVVPGDVIRASSYVNVISAASVGCRLEIIYVNSSQVFISQGNTPMQTGTGEKYFYLEGTVPANGAFAYVRPVLAQNATASTFDAYIDSVMVTKNAKIGAFWDETASFAQGEQVATNIYVAHGGVGLNEQRFGYKDGVLPQNQSLVSGRVLTITLPKNYSTSNARTIAVSHKRYIQSDPTMPVAPISMSAYFRTPVTDSQIQVTMRVYSSSSPGDITSINDFAGDTLLGTKTASGGQIDTYTVDGQLLFEQVFHTFVNSTGVPGDTMSINTDRGTYIYVTLEVAPTTTLTSDKLIELDNVDLVIGERLTPSDSQPIADLARRLTDTQTLLTYMLSGTKAVLPELSSGLQGLRSTVVT